MTHKVQITDTILRDAHQSLIATRMRTEDMVPALEVLDRAGYWSLEMWGGATFDVCMRFLDEDPWERLRTIRKHVKHTKLQMLLRGQNLVGYRHYADDVVDAFVEHAHANGIDVFRIFDALNDVRNLVPAMHAVRRVGAIVEASLSYTVSPVHTIEGFVAFARQLKDEGAQVLCIKDMAGMISTTAASQLIRALKEEVGLPVHLHTHCASGMAPATYWAAAEAGVDILDCALSPFSWGTSQPPTETIAGMFRDTPWDTGLDADALFEAARHFQKVRERYLPILDRRSERVDTGILLHQTPGGMLSNLISQLKTQKAEDRFAEVLEETARVRKDLGYPPLVTPTSQIVGTQAVFNVVLGERYKMITKEVRDYVKGLYGRPPAAIDPALAAKVLGDELPFTGRPAERLPPELHTLVDHVKAWGATPERALEEALSYALFPEVATEFYAARREGRKPRTAEPPPEEMVSKAEPVSVDRAPGGRELVLDLGGRRSTVRVDGVPRPGGVFRLQVEGTSYEVKVAPRADTTRRARKEATVAQGDGVIRAPLPGVLLRFLVSEGQEVKREQPVAVLEAMKMQNEIQAHRDGTVKALHAKTSQSLEVGQAILEIA
ncbi:MAG: pyruvate/oxaloacetate carboxyltransferase [Deltaproteobacteria bacterium]|nr:pyruvate/oxaloacetate carboxyltransferase [Deltaproteobacteria bacterium]